jgi:low temperature requirement protein LtrA
MVRNFQRIRAWLLLRVFWISELADPRCAAGALGAGAPGYFRHPWASGFRTRAVNDERLGCRGGHLAEQLRPFLIIALESILVTKRDLQRPGWTLPIFVWRFAVNSICDVKMALFYFERRQRRATRRSRVRGIRAGALSYTMFTCSLSPESSFYGRRGRIRGPSARARTPKR